MDRYVHFEAQTASSFQRFEYRARFSALLPG
jgi:hypothetical protein